MEEKLTGLDFFEAQRISVETGRAIRFCGNARGDDLPDSKKPTLWSNFIIDGDQGRLGNHGSVCLRGRGGAGWWPTIEEQMQKAWEVEPEKPKGILFRGKEILTGEWQIGFFLRDEHGVCWISNQQPGKAFRRWTVKPETVGQYTGMKDSDDEKIFEGDICKCHIFTQELGENMGVREGEREFICAIEYGSAGVILNNRQANSGPIWAYNGFHDESLKKIGNIHDNHELLEEK